jgi:hypothetical protein
MRRSNFCFLLVAIVALTSIACGSGGTVDSSGSGKDGSAAGGADGEAGTPGNDAASDADSVSDAASDADSVSDAASDADSVSDAASDADSASDALSDATELVVDSSPLDAAELDSSFACGSAVCGPGQVCVHPCCGGAAPPCTARPDGGVCPSGWRAVVACPGIDVPACQAPMCTPPPAYCFTPSAACQSDAACGCFDTACTGGGCWLVTGRVVMCGCA